MLLAVIVSVAMCSPVNVAVAQEISGSFRCESHTVAIDRFPGAIAVSPQDDTTNSTRILEAQFSGFDPQYPVESVHFRISFVRDQTNIERAVGRLRILASIGNHDSEQVKEIIDGDNVHVGSQVWYDNWELSRVLHVSFETAETGEALADSDDPMVDHSGRPQVRIHQAEAKKPVFLIKFIGLTAAGGWGEVDTEEAIVLDLRSGDLVAPAAVGCVKNDFAGQNHEDESIECLWNQRYGDYVCRTNAYYGRDWNFLLIQGRKLPRKIQSGKH